ncbi:MAG: sporulation protein YabP [Butyrivibrio sp.]
MEEKTIAVNHQITMMNRKTGTITGVKDVISFDLTSILLETDCGMITLKGHDLHVNRLSVERGELDISGTIDSLQYSDVNSYAKKGTSILARWFQ